MKHYFLLYFLLLTCATTSYSQYWDEALDCNINSQSDLLRLARQYRQPIREATVKLDIQGRCTGTLLNQEVAQNQLRYYILTARHCTIGVNFDVEHTLYFNYQSPDANTDHTESTNRGEITGQTYDTLNLDGSVDKYFKPTAHEYAHTTKLRLIGHYQWGDFSLLEVLTPPPPHFNFSFAGWNPSLFHNGIEIGTPNYFIDPYVSYHHPKGDIKKVSGASNIIYNTSVIATGCYTVTTVIDVLFGWIWDHQVSTQVICNYADIPFLQVFWADGITEGGSSGASLANINNKVIGQLKGWPLHGCDGGFSDFYGKFRSNYFNHSIMNSLNPSRNTNANLFGLAGRKITCYDNLELPGAPGVSGHYFPAKHYQPENTITLQANNNIDIVRPLHVYNEADYRFRAGNVITINPGFEAEAGSTVVFENLPCGGAAKEANPEQQLLASLRNIRLPRSKTFDAQSLAGGSLYGSAQTLTMQVFPNPSSGAFTLRLSQKGDYQITLTDMLGKDVASFEISGEKEKTFHAPLPAGQYLLRVWGNGQTAVGKISIVE